MQRAWVNRPQGGVQTVRIVKTPETDNRVVDYLYDDLPDAQRTDFSAHLKSDEEAASEAQSYATLLKLYREEADELTPSVAATERLLRAAEREHQSLWTRIFGALMPRLVLRPAVGFAMVAVLLIGVGVFYVLSQGPGSSRGPGTASGASEAERTVASAPASRPKSEITRTAVAEAADEGVVKEKGAVRGEGRFARDQTNQPATARGAGGLRGFDTQQGALAARTKADADREVRLGLRGRRSRSATKKKQRYFKVDGTGNAATRSLPAGKAPAPAPAQAAPQSGAADTMRKVQQQAVAQNKDKVSKKLSPPALHNRARKNLAKGQVAVACRMFGSLVRGNRSYSRRADALQGWARCEMARGSYSRATQLVRQLISEYPNWKKTGQGMLAEIKRRQARAALRAQRVRRVKRRPARPAPRRSSSTSQ